MWKCSGCHETIPDNFDVCWNCGAEYVDASSFESEEIPPVRSDPAAAPHDATTPDWSRFAEVADSADRSFSLPYLGHFLNRLGGELLLLVLQIAAFAAAIWVGWPAAPEARYAFLFGLAVGAMILAWRIAWTLRYVPLRAEFSRTIDVSFFLAKRVYELTDVAAWEIGEDVPNSLFFALTNSRKYMVVITMTNHDEIEFIVDEYDRMIVRRYQQEFLKPSRSDSD